MVNAGAIVTTSLVKPELNLADRFEYVSICDSYRQLCLCKYLW